MIKDPESTYTPGRRGKSWLKLKRELATLDVVVTAVEYGHGKRIGVLSDYTFAVRDGERLVNIGKAYSGLTDAEIAEMTKWFLEHTIEDQGFRLVVEPKIVLEVAFNNMMRSDRHESGYALRFPRIVRMRPDKPPEEADTIERAREIYEKQKHAPAHALAPRPARRSRNKSRDLIAEFNGCAHGAPLRSPESRIHAPLRRSHSRTGWSCDRCETLREGVLSHHAESAR